VGGPALGSRCDLCEDWSSDPGEYDIADRGLACDDVAIRPIVQFRATGRSDREKKAARYGKEFSVVHETIQYLIVSIAIIEKRKVITHY
jgi:hypothetical protein